MDSTAISAWFRLFEWAPGDPSWLQRRKAIWAWRKQKKARRWVRVLRFVPFVRMIAIGNDLGYGNCSDASDIDLVIVTAPRRVWFARLCVVALLRLSRQRPGEHSRDAICPSFFLTTEAMDLEELQIGAESRIMNNESWDRCDASLPLDPYLLFWVTQLTVLYDVGGTYDAFWRANGQWARRWLPDARPRAMHPRLVVRHCEPKSRRFASLGDKLREVLPAQGTDDRDCHEPMAIGSRNDTQDGWPRRLGDALERWCRAFQERRFSSEVRALVNRDTRVIATDRMLKFHTSDRRAEYRDRWLIALNASAHTSARQAHTESSGTLPVHGCFR